MTIINVLVEPHRLTAVTDTLVVHRPREAQAPRALATKVIPLPAFRGLLGFSGPTLVGAQVLLRTFSAPSADIETLAEPVARALPGYLEAADQAYGAVTGPGVGVILAGWSPARGRFVGFALTYERGAAAVGVDVAESGCLAMPDVIADAETLTTERDLMAAVDRQLAEADVARGAGGELWRYRVDPDGACRIDLARTLPIPADLPTTPETSRHAA